MRIFIALDIEDYIRERIARFVEGMHGFAPDARWVRPESMHITLKFIGEKSEQAVGGIKQALETVDSGSVEIRFRGHGFFPTAKAPRVFWIGIEAGPQLASLASAVDEKMASLGIPKEEYVFSPHLTLARGGSRSASPRLRKEDRPNRCFQRLQEKLTAMPTLEFGTMTAHEFSLYKSQLSRTGSQYTKLAAFDLR
jgi:2'-5' RNA ligase